ncbi:putative secreted protein [Hymenobacter sp. UYAg731]
MSLNPIKGRDIGLAVQKTVGSTPTYVVVGCVTDASFDVDTEADEATCWASGKWKEYIGGQNGFSLSGTLNVRQAINDTTGTGMSDADNNVTAENLLDLQIADDPQPIQIQYRIGSATGSARYAGLGIITKSSFKGQLKGIATYSISVQGTGPLAKTLAPA